MRCTPSGCGNPLGTSLVTARNSADAIDARSAAHVNSCCNTLRMVSGVTPNFRFAQLTQMGTPFSSASISAMESRHRVFRVGRTALRVCAFRSWARRSISPITILLFASITSRSAGSSEGCSLGRTPASAASKAAMQSGKLSRRRRKRLSTSRVSALNTSMTLAVYLFDVTSSVSASFPRSAGGAHSGFASLQQTVGRRTRAKTKPALCPDSRDF